MRPGNGQLFVYPFGEADEPFIKDAQLGTLSSYPGAFPGGNDGFFLQGDNVIVHTTLKEDNTSAVRRWWYSDAENSLISSGSAKPMSSHYDVWHVRGDLFFFSDRLAKPSRAGQEWYLIDMLEWAVTKITRQELANVANPTLNAVSASIQVIQYQGFFFDPRPGDHSSHVILLFSRSWSNGGMDFLFYDASGSINSPTLADTDTFKDGLKQAPVFMQLLDRTDVLYCRAADGTHWYTRITLPQEQRQVGNKAWKRLPAPSQTQNTLVIVDEQVGQQSPLLTSPYEGANVEFCILYKLQRTDGYRDFQMGCVSQMDVASPLWSFLDNVAEPLLEAAPKNAYHVYLERRNREWLMIMRMWYLPEGITGPIFKMYSSEEPFHCVTAPECAVGCSRSSCLCCPINHYRCSDGTCKLKCSAVAPATSFHCPNGRCYAPDQVEECGCILPDSTTNERGFPCFDRTCVRDKYSCSPAPIATVVPLVEATIEPGSEPGVTELGVKDKNGKTLGTVTVTTNTTTKIVIKSPNKKEKQHVQNEAVPSDQTIVTAMLEFAIESPEGEDGPTSIELELNLPNSVEPNATSPLVHVLKDNSQVISVDSDEEADGEEDEGDPQKTPKVTYTIVFHNNKAKGKLLVESPPSRGVYTVLMGGDFRRGKEEEVEGGESDDIVPGLGASLGAVAAVVIIVALAAGFAIKYRRRKKFLSTLRSKLRATETNPPEPVVQMQWS
ncbi:hypothetical protein QOT17_002232 [Balamuthia mandrillaris]